MSIFARGTAPKLLRLGVEHVLRAMLDGVAIWDGTVPAQVQVPRALASAAAVVPVVSSTPGAIAPPPAAASAAALAPTPSNSSSIVATVATATTDAPVSAVSADAVVFAPAATSSATAVPILSDANVSVPTAIATVEALVPGIETTGSTIVVPPPAMATADAPVPIVSASKSVTAPIATASAAASAGTGISIGLPVPAATASAAAVVPTVAAMNFAPSGMTKNGSVAWAGSATWVAIQNWTANTGTYPGSSVDGSHRLVIQGSKTNASISGQAAYTGGGFARTHSIRVVDQSGNVIATGSPNTNTSGNCTVSATGVDLTGVTALALQMSGDFSAGTLSSGASTFLTVT
ncbi:hypothetical protein ACWFRF_20940 [Nocardia sp. NPDC055165]